jgi:hypothetical protein
MSLDKHNYQAKKDFFRMKVGKIRGENMSNQRVYKKGEVLFKDGDKISNVVFIQQGAVSQCLIRGKKNVELFQLGANQVLGEGLIAGQSTHQTGAIATTETKVLEIPADVFKQQYEAAPQFLKMLLKSLADRMKQAIAEVRSSKMDKDSTPCPDEAVPRVFGALFFAGNHKGEKQKDGKLEIEWTVLKSYAQRVLGESPKRLEQAANILVKLKLAHYNMGKLPEDPDGPDVIQQIVVYDMSVVEAFFEFFQYYLYKPGKADLIKYDETCTNILEVMIKCCEGLTPDRFGVVSIDFAKTQEEVKNQTGINLSNDQLSRLEQKGIMSKRRNVEGQGVKLEFEIKEYKNYLFSWKIIREIDKWNEKGSVDINEKEEKKKKTDGPICPQCSAVTSLQQKFCAQCGAKLNGQAA